MPMTAYHASTAGGAYVFFGNDIVDGQPIGPVKLANHATFYHDPHSGDMNRLRIAALLNASKIAAGIDGTTPIAPTPGQQTAWFRQGSGIPGQETE